MTQEHDTPVEQPQPEAGTSLREFIFDELPDPLKAAAHKSGWASLMPVQAKTIPFLLEGQDLMVQSRTGSGKTGAFLIPILMRLDPKNPVCQAMVLVPTRELALQVSREAEYLSAGSDLNTVVVYGGVGYGPQLDGFKKGAHLVVGTPGRILDHLLKKSLRLDHLKMLVFDEADRMMSMGFYPDMMEIRSYVPDRCEGYMFSATYPVTVRRLARSFLRKPESINLSEESVHVTDTSHIFYVVPGMEKDRCLVRIIEAENPSSAIIFCNTKARVDYVTQVLQRFGYDADQLTSDLAQKARERVLDRVRQGRLRFLVATDVAARGIDIVNLSHVFLYDFPEDHESYIHRAGRTGRAGAVGVAISLVDVMEKTELVRVAKRYEINMEARTAPSDEDIQGLVAERVTALLEARLRGRDRIQNERMQRFIALARSLGESDDELAVIAMLLDDFYQESLHAPPFTPSGDTSTMDSSTSKPGRGTRPRRGRGGSSREQ